MEKSISFGKIAFNGKRKANEVTIDIELKYDYKNRPCFSADASVWNTRHTDIVMGGQCLDELLPFFKNNPKFLQIHELWKKYHLNNMHAGTPEQESALKEWHVRTNQKPDFSEDCEYLMTIGLYEVKDPETDGNYTYGSRWLYWDIPKDDLEKIHENMCCKN